MNGIPPRACRRTHLCSALTLQDNHRIYFVNDWMVKRKNIVIIFLWKSYKSCAINPKYVFSFHTFFDYLNSATWSNIDTFLGYLFVISYGMIICQVFRQNVFSRKWERFKNYWLRIIYKFNFKYKWNCTCFVWHFVAIYCWLKQHTDLQVGLVNLTLMTDMSQNTQPRPYFVDTPCNRLIQMILVGTYNIGLVVKIRDVIMTNTLSVALNNMHRTIRIMCSFYLSNFHFSAKWNGEIWNHFLLCLFCLQSSC